MQFLIITSCTSRKRGGLSSPLTIKDLDCGNHTELATQWLCHADNALNKVRAEEMYTGRSVFEVKKAAKLIDADIYFASTGFGLINKGTLIPNYDLTVADSKQTLSQKINSELFSAQTWWRTINEIRKIKPISSILEYSSNLTILLALPKTYLELIKLDLESIKEKNIHQLRIFTSSENYKTLPEIVKSAYIPYDDRFDGNNSPNPGTRSDYPQRVLRHFIEFILNPNNMNLEIEKEKVLEMLDGMRVRPRIERIKLSDQEISIIIEKNWEKALGVELHSELTHLTI